MSRVVMPRVHRDDLVVKTREPRLMFGQDLRFECAGAVARNLQFQFPEIPFYRLAARPIARIPAVVARRVVPLVSQVMGQLGI